MRSDSSQTILQFALVVCVAMEACTSSRPAHDVPPALEQYAELYREDHTEEAAQRYRRECPEPVQDPQSAVDDGVNRCEARALAQAYQFINSGACGAVGYPVRRGPVWLVPSYVGYAGTPSVPIEVVEATGEARTAAR